MYTVYDFINSEIEPKHMKFGWKVEIQQSNSLSCGNEIVLRYTMLNFDWHSLEYLNGEVWNMFLSSKSYQNMKEKLDRAALKHKRLYYNAFSIEGLKIFTEENGLKVNIDRLIEKAIRRKSEKVKERLENLKNM